MKIQNLFTVITCWFYLPHIGRCEGCSGQRYFRFDGPHNLVAKELKHQISESIAPCFYICSKLHQCTAMAVFPVNDSLDCTFLNTDARVIGSTEKHLSTPLRSKPSFSLYLNTLRQGKVGNILKSLDYPSWAGNPWSTLSGYLAHGRLTGIRVWYGTVSQARFIHGVQIQHNEHWTSVHGAAIGTRGEFLLADGETIVTIRYFVDYKQTSGMEFTTSSGTTFGPFGFEDGNEIVIRTRELLWISGGVDELWTYQYIPIIY